MLTSPTRTQAATGTRRVAVLHAQMIRAQCSVPRIQARVLALREERNAAIRELRREGCPLPDILAVIPLTAYDIVDVSRVWERAGPGDDSTAALP